MGLDNDQLGTVDWIQQRYCLFDIETSVIADVDQFIEVGKPPANYTKPDTITKWHQENTAKQIAWAALDLDLCRVGCIGYCIEDEEDIFILTADEAHEATMLNEFWRVALDRELIGFNILGFDLAVLLRRSLYLGLPVPRIHIDRYRHDHITDLLELLSFNRKEYMRGLGFYCRRFGIPYDDTIPSADMPALIATNEWKLVIEHCMNDVKATRDLARRIGAVRPPVEMPKELV